MTIAAHIRSTLALPNFVVGKYLEDLSDSELLVRPLPEMNHIAWQLGHLIAGEHFHISQVAEGAMPNLPEGFAERHSKDTAASDDPQDFLAQGEYLELMEQQREGTLRTLDAMSDEQLMAPSPESIRYFGPTVGAVFAGEATHWMMHAGQWAVVRRKLGRPPLF
ncbi:MAG: DinB family protein [Planctomycetales bacterium]|nr:DinB family protein [Planctomycetales bacterium]